MVFAGWFSHFGDKSWWELIERPDRIAPLLSSMGALLMRHFGDKFVDQENTMPAGKGTYGRKRGRPKKKKKKKKKQVYFLTKI